MPKDVFEFKQFTLEQDRCAMKVGTDSVLLGAWVNAFNRKRALDIGTGTGVLSLMLTQREPNIKVDGVEIDRIAGEQAKDNFKKSKWSDRLQCIHAPLSDLEIIQLYDLIISNPPYFSPQANASATARKLAREEVTLGMNELMKTAFRLSTGNALLALVYPFERRSSLIKRGLENGWFHKRSCEVSDTPGRPPVRLLVEFSKTSNEIPTAEHLIIRKEDGTYHDNYIALTKEFYTIF